MATDIPAARLLSFMCQPQAGKVSLTVQAGTVALPASAPWGVITGAGALAGHLRAAASDLAGGPAASVSTIARR